VVVQRQLSRVRSDACLADPPGPGCLRVFGCYPFGGAWPCAAGTLSRMDGRNLRKGAGIVNQGKSAALFGSNAAQKTGRTSWDVSRHVSRVTPSEKARGTNDCAHKKKRACSGDPRARFTSHHQRRWVTSRNQRPRPRCTPCRQR